MFKLPVEVSNNPNLVLVDCVNKFKLAVDSYIFPNWKLTDALNSVIFTLFTLPLIDAVTLFAYIVLHFVPFVPKSYASFVPGTKLVVNTPSDCIVSPAAPSPKIILPSILTFCLK